MQSTVFGLLPPLLADSVLRSPATGLFAIAPDSGRDRTAVAGTHGQGDGLYLSPVGRGGETDAKVKSDRQVLQQHLRKLAALALAAMKSD